MLKAQIVGGDQQNNISGAVEVRFYYYNFIFIS